MADQFLSQEEVDALLDGVNGDTPEAVEIARAVRAALEGAGVEVAGL